MNLGRLTDVRSGIWLWHAHLNWLVGVVDVTTNQRGRCQPYS